jgi:hypothetical protein
MAGTFTSVSSTSYFGRIRNAILGFILGPILLIVACWLIFWNESHSVRVAKSLKEGSANIVEAPEFNAGNDGKLVHVTGDTATEGTLRDPEFGVEAQGIRLDRKVLVYAWVQKESSNTTTNAAGTKKTTKTYKYEKEWVSSLPKSSSFKEKEGHENPSQLKYKSKSFAADKVTLGGYTLDSELVEKLTETKPVSLDKEKVEVPEGATLNDDEIYFGSDRSNPEVGDLRISEAVVANGPVSVVAGQGAHARLTPFATKAGEPIALVETGMKSAETMFANAHSANRTFTWFARLGGFVLLLIGFLLLLGPLSTMSSIVPFFGGIFEAGMFLISFLGAVVVWSLITAIAWMVARPLMGGILFAICIGALVLAIRHIRRGTAKRAQATVSAAPA